MAAWTAELIDRLIELYQERPCLYNTKMKEYHDRDMRKKALEEIATAIEVPGKPCKYIHHLCTIGVNYTYLRITQHVGLLRASNGVHSCV